MTLGYDIKVLGTLMAWVRTLCYGNGFTFIAYHVWRQTRSNERGARERNRWMEFLLTNQGNWVWKIDINCWARVQIAKPFRENFFSQMLPSFPPPVMLLPAEHHPYVRKNLESLFFFFLFSSTLLNQTKGWRTTFFSQGFFHHYYLSFLLAFSSLTKS